MEKLWYNTSVIDEVLRKRMHSITDNYYFGRGNVILLRYWYRYVW